MNAEDWKITIIKLLTTKNIITYPTSVIKIGLSVVFDTYIIEYYKRCIPNDTIMKIDMILLLCDIHGRSHS